MKLSAKPGFLLVASRECRWLFHDRVALLLMFAIPLFALLVLSAVFSQQVIRGLGVVVIDRDRSATSRTFIEEVAAAPGLNIVRRTGDLASAAQAIRSGDAIAAVYIPADFERDLKAQRRPQVVAFYNQQYLTASGIAATDLSNSLAAGVRKAAGPAAPKASSTGSLVAETIVLVNPEKNYAQFLLRSLLPMVLHVVIAITAGYAVGSEFGRRSMRTWLASAGGDPIVALAGKLAPLFFVFFVIMLVVPIILEGIFAIPFKGNVPIVIIAGVLMIIAHLSLGALLQLVARNLVTGLSFTSAFVSPAFGYLGVGFPIQQMNDFSQVWSALLPLRWYLAVLFGQGARGLSLHDTARPFAALAALTVLYSLLAVLRLRAIGASIPRAETWNPAGAPADAQGVVGAFAGEFRRIFTTRSAFTLLIIGPVLYGIYYPQPYLTQILRNIPIAVVDNDLSELSRNIVQTLDASGAVKVAVRAGTLAEARAAIDRGEAFAAVGIPPGTERDVLKGVSAHIPVYADATYLFLFRTTGSGIATALGTLSAELASGGARTDSSLVKASLAASSPAEVLLQPIFNPVGGYGSYVVPGAFVLILQQTLLLGAAMLTGPALAQAAGGALASVVGRGIAHLALYLPAMLLYFIVLPQLYGFSVLGDPLQLFTLAAVFILATSFMGQAVGAWFKRPETGILIFLATSLPQFFLTGFAWPREAISGPLLAFGVIFPSDLAINGLVRINQLGASIWEVAHNWGGLWLLAIVYFALAVVSAHLVRRRQADA